MAKTSIPSVPRLFRSRGRLAVGLGVGLLLPLWALGGLIAGQARQTLSTEAEAQLQSATQLSAQVVREHFAGLSDYLGSFATRPDLVEAILRRDMASASAVLAVLVEGNRSLSRAFITDPAGVEIADHPHVPDVIGQSFAHRDWFQGVSVSGRPYISGVYQRAAAPAVDTVALATPVNDVDGELIAYLVAQDTVETLSTRLHEVRPSPTGGIALFDRDGVLANRGAGPRQRSPALSKDPLMARAMNQSASVVRAQNPLSSEPSLLSFTRLEEDGWLVMAYDSEAAVMAPALQLQWAILVLTALGFLCVFLLSFSATDVFRHQNQALVNLQESKTQVTNLLIHDLRNPLTAIMSGVELARAGLPESLPEINEDLNQAAASARRLLAMINVLIDIARMEDGALPTSKAPQELVALLQSKVEEYTAAAEERHLALVARLPDRPVVAPIDRDLISRVIENLIINALKHTPAGGHVSVELEEDSRRQAVVVVRVRDDGEGIPEHLLPSLFQKYGRGEGQTMSSRYDVGLGLCFCRMAIELHGGSIAVESKVGEGTMFSIELPAV